MSNIFTNNLITDLAINSPSEILFLATVLIIFSTITLCKIIFILEKKQTQKCPKKSEGGK